VQVSASPSTIAYGEKSTLTGNATGSDCGGPATIRYTASEGTISGNTFDSSGVSFDMNNRAKQQTKTVTITATATDAKGGTATATTNIVVTMKPEGPAARRHRVPDGQLASQQLRQAGTSRRPHGNVAGRSE
jgi:hypothetical protein